MDILNAFKKSVFTLSLSLMLFPAFQVFGQDTVSIGMYFNSVYDLDLADKSFTADFWIWYNYRNDSLSPLESVEISNAKEFEFTLPDVEKVGEVNWATHKCKAVLKKEWDLRDFPFDKQYLHIVLEDAMEESSSVVYVADSLNSKFDKEIILDGWIIKGFYVQGKNKEYETTYGNPALQGKSIYPSVVATFVLTRDGSGLFWKLFMGVYVAFLISIAGFFMGPENPERFGLIVGALFAGVANKYIVDSIMPQTIAVTLPDKIHNLTFAYIIAHLVLTIIAYRLAINNKMKTGWRFDKIAFIVSLLTFILGNYLLIRQAL